MMCFTEFHCIPFNFAFSDILLVAWTRKWWDYCYKSAFFFFPLEIWLLNTFQNTTDDKAKHLWWWGILNREEVNLKEKAPHLLIILEAVHCGEIETVSIKKYIKTYPQCVSQGNSNHKQQSLVVNTMNFAWKPSSAMYLTLYILFNLSWPQFSLL